MKQLKYVKDCNNSNCVTHSTETNEDGEVLTYIIKNYRTFNKKQIVKTTYFDDGQFMLSDGSMYLIENPNGIGSSILITIDINGINKKPNLWGHDLFTFQITDSGKLLPMGASGTTFEDSFYCSATSQSTLNGIACTYKALNDKNYWKNLP